MIAGGGAWIFPKPETGLSDVGFCGRSAKRLGQLGGGAAIGLVALALIGPPALQAETDPIDAPLQVVRYGETDTLRGLVGQHLNDPDLWPVVLRLNDIASPADLVPGAELRLPVRQVLAADSALATALGAIQRATAEGARIFAPAEIGAAVENRETAITHRGAGAWRDAVDFAGLATGQANTAYDISLAQRDRAAEAVVSDVQGSVEGRAPAEPSWSGRAVDDILVEFERLRTLSNSTTQVTFRDLSRLRLNPNSNATIQRMRSDPLTGGEVTKVSLANGDFYALLNQLSEKSTFEIDVPGVETTTNSADFWIKNDDSGARFVNYDKAGLEIRRGGETITVGENEGVVLTGAGAQRAAVLSAPQLAAPAPGAVVYTAAAALEWAPFDAAEAYWLEIAADPGFNAMRVSEWGLRDTRFEATLPPARYYWRVAALDRLGLPGEWSASRDFAVRVDTTPPFLTLLSPAPGSLLSRPRVELLGASEPGAALSLDGAPLEIGADGSFLTELDLVPGENRFTVRAVDAAGNDSSRSLSVIYRPAAQVTVALAPDAPRAGAALATRSAEITVEARSNAEPGAAVAVRDAGGRLAVQTRVGPDGGFGFTLPADAAPRRYRIEVLSPGGAVEGARDIAVVRDQVAPDLVLDLPPPRATGVAQLALAGHAGDAVSLTLGGTLVPLGAQGRFDLTLTLTPGENAFELVASDAVGNLSVLPLNTVLDIDPPRILGVDLGRPQGAAGPIDLTVRAEDASGLRQAARFVIAVGGAERAGFLRCDSAAGLCRASLPAEPGALQLIELIIEDYAGNAAFR